MQNSKSHHRYKESIDRNKKKEYFPTGKPRGRPPKDTSKRNHGRSNISSSRQSNTYRNRKEVWRKGWKESSGWEENRRKAKRGRKKEVNRRTEKPKEEEKAVEEKEEEDATKRKAEDEKPEEASPEKAAKEAECQEKKEEAKAWTTTQNRKQKGSQKRTSYEDCEVVMESTSKVSKPIPKVKIEDEIL